MKYYSTRSKSDTTSLKEAVIQGLAPDKGLFMPERFPVLTRSELERIKKADLAETGVIISQKLFGEDVPADELEKIVRDAIYFDTPLVEVSDKIFSLELFHGPTLAFKDVGARFMARLLQYFTRGESETVHVLVATSGDTGSAVANGFLGMENIKVHVLYPSGQVSPLQEKQFSTLGENITALEVAGSFDDCQALVKSAFADETLKGKIYLTSANSINLARFLPQSFYYFRGWAQAESDQLVMAVPSGNFGNLTAGLIGREMGLPVNTFLAASNANNVVPEYLETGEYKPRASVSTIANAMDVGAPSNFERILDLFNKDHGRLSRHIKGYTYSDDEIRKVIKEIYKETRYILDPHGATGYEASREFLKDHPDYTAIFFETAHPAKFGEVVNKEIGKEVDIPERLEAFASRKKISVPMTKEYSDFQEYLKNVTLTH
jgi:threonine synthase